MVSIDTSLPRMAVTSAYFQKPLTFARFSNDLESILHCWLPN